MDKSNWINHRFDEIAFSISEKVDPTNTDLEIYVGLEHLDPESIHIKRYGQQGDVKGTKLRCYPGDVIFGRRRAYQRKAAVVDFDGFCSAHSLVLRAIPETIDPKLFPFFLHSDLFMHRAVDISVGSLSPTINWKTLKQQEFLLPPKDQQAKIAELLWAMDDVVEKELKLLNGLITTMEVESSELIWNQNHHKEPLVKYADESIQKLVDGDWIESKDQSPNGIRLIQLADIGVRDFINKSSRYISEETFDRLKCFEVFPGDVIIARMPDPIGRACIIEDVSERMITAVDCCIARVDNSHSNKKFLMYMLNSREFIHNATRLSSGTTRKRISRKNLEKIKVPKPDLQIQNKIEKKLDSVFLSINYLKTKIKQVKQLQKSLINEIFEV